MQPCLLAVVAAASSSLASAQSTWYVDDNGVAPGTGTPADPYTSIQYALTRPSTLAGDTVLVLPGLYHEALDFLGKNVEVRSQGGASVTTLDAGGSGSSAVTFRNGETSAAKLDGFTVRRGSGTLVSGVKRGGGVYVAGASPQLSNCIVENNMANEGGGLAFAASSATLMNVTVRSNLAEFQAFTKDGPGGGILASAGANVTGSAMLVRTNDGGNGGGLYAASGGTLTLSDSTIELNDANGDGLLPGLGGGAYVEPGATLGLTSVEIRDNVAWFDDARGGGVYCAGTLTADLCTFSGNGASDVPFFSNWVGRGGGIYAAGTVDVTNSTLSGNYGPVEGGGAFGGHYTDCLFVDNQSEFGAGACTGTFTGCTFQTNTAISFGSGDFGGGVDGPATLTNCTLTGNMSFGDGAGARNATLIGCTLSQNVANSPSAGTPARGGGAYGCVLVDCVLIENEANGSPFADVGQGGGVSASTATRCVLRGNKADSGGGASDSDLVNCTMVANTNSEAPLTSGAYYSFGASGSLLNCIVAQNGSGQQIDAPGVPVTYTDVSGSVGVVGTGNLNANPSFWDGLSNDFHLKPVSPCIDAGDPTSPLDPDGSRADQGAYPFDAGHCSPAATYCTAKVNSLGCTPTIGSNNAPSIGGGTFEVTASNVLNNKNGLLFWSITPNGAPFFGGTLCVKPPAQRTPLQNSGGNPPPNDCSGTYSFVFSSAYLAAEGLTLGVTLHAQYWSRDSGFSVPANIGLTDALRFTLCQ